MYACLYYTTGRGIATRLIPMPKGRGLRRCGFGHGDPPLRRPAWGVSSSPIGLTKRGNRRYTATPPPVYSPIILHIRGIALR